MSIDSGPSTHSLEISGSCGLPPARRGMSLIGAIRGMCEGVFWCSRAVWGRRRSLCLCALGVLTLAWGLGLVLFLRVGAHAPVTVSLPILEPHPHAEHNLVAYRYGTVLRSSSYFRDRVAQHHPAFLVDGRAHPGLVEKWASDPTDTRPWVELLWTGDRDIRRVRIQHAGDVESSEYTSRQYDMTCLCPHPPPALVVTNNTASVAEHDFHCPGARGLRIDFMPNAPGALVRVFEVEVWGQ
jgi:hypothetical protein